MMFHKIILFRVTLAPDKFYDSVMRKRLYAISLCRYDLIIYGASRGQKDAFVPGNGVPRDPWHCPFRLSFYNFGAAIVISSTITVVICGVE